MKVKFILPSLAEAGSPFWRPIKYSLFPPLGLATLAGFLGEEDEAIIEDHHVEKVNLHDDPDLVVIQVYITNAMRAYRLADHYRRKGKYVILGGLHVTALPHEAAQHADTIFLGPAEQTFPSFLRDFKNGHPQKKYISARHRTLHGIPRIRRDLIKRQLYLVPNSLVISRGCPYHCDFCYKDAFFAGGKSYYTQKIDTILQEIDRLPGRHLYFLDDHLFANPRFAVELFGAMRGMDRVFQGAATVNSIIKGPVLEASAKAGLRSLFVGFETLDASNLRYANKKQNLKQDYSTAIQRLHDFGIMINGSFVFGMDGDHADVFDTTVQWAVEQALTTATFHILTPYPGTRLYENMRTTGRLLHTRWEEYDTRHVVYQPRGMSAQELEEGYKHAYQMFYSWSNIFKASFAHDQLKHQLKHLCYAGGWKKLEPFWGGIIRHGNLKYMLPLLEMLLCKVRADRAEGKKNHPLQNKISTALSSS